MDKNVSIPDPPAIVNYWTDDDRPPLNVLFPSVFPYINRDCLRGPGNTMAWGCTLPGLMYEIMIIVANGINHRLVIKVDESGNFSQSSLLEMLEPGVYDTIAYPIQLSNDYEIYTDISEPLYSVDSNIFIRASGHMDGWWNMFRTYDKTSWALVGLMVLLQALFVCYIQRVEMKTFLKRNQRPHEVFWQILRIQCLQNHDLHFRLKAGKFSIWLFAFLQGSILLGVFSSWFLSLLIRQPSFADMKQSDYIFSQLKSGKRKLITEGSTQRFAEYNTNGALYLDFKLALEGKEIYNNGPKAVVERVLSEDAIMYARADWYSYQYAALPCDVIKANINFPALGTHLIFPLNSSFTPLVNKVIKDNKLKFRYLSKRYMDIVSSDSIVNIFSICKKFRPGHPLKMSFFIGLFIVTGGLLLIATTILLFEMFVSNFHMNKTP